jgi:hypothetical protein
MTDIPIACTLSDDQMSGRVAFVERLAADALLGQEQIAGGVRSRFLDTADVERRLHELVAAEASCCAFLTMSVTRRGGELWLEVTGAAEAAALTGLVRSQP